MCNSRAKICCMTTGQAMKRQQGFTTGTTFYVYNVISFNFEMVHHGLVVIMPELLINDSRTIPRWEGYDLLIDV